MRLDVDAVIYKKGKWYDGNLNGFSFRIDRKVNSSKDITHISGHVSLKQWLKDNGIKDINNKIASTLMKNVYIYALKNGKTKVSEIAGRGVEKMFIYTMASSYDASKLDINFLCAQCMWTCKQGNGVMIYSCKAFDTKKPK